MKIKKGFRYLLALYMLLIIGDVFMYNGTAQELDPIFYNVGFGGMTEEDLEEISNATTIIPYDSNKVMEGYNMFSRQSTGDIYFMDLEGNIIASRKDAGDPELVNATTVLYYDRVEGENVAFLWNLKTNITESFSNFSAGHHDVEYNPKTHTFLVLNGINYGTYTDYNFTFNETDIKYDDVIEYDIQGNELWYWNSSEYIPFNSSWYLNETTRVGDVDWTHTNAIFWDIDEDMVYYNPRHLDTIYKIDKSTGEVLWEIGKWGDYTLLDKFGNEVESLWYHSHSMEKIGPNRFIIFDNDYYNSTRDDPENGFSRMIEIEVDELTKTTREVWSWVSPNNYFSSSWGDADRLPNGNRLGVFGNNEPTPPHLTEISPDGEIVWELMLNDSVGGKWGIYRAERLLKEPLIIIEDVNPTVDLDIENSSFDFSVWDTYRSRYTIESGSLKVVRGSTVIYEKPFSFLPFWQETSVSLNSSEIGKNFNLGRGSFELTIIIENAAEQQTSQDIVLIVKKTMQPYLVGIISGTSAIAVAGMLIYIKITTRLKREI